MPSHSLQSYVATASEVCARWNVEFQVPADADDDRAASIIRAGLMRAGKAAAASEAAPFYWDDNSWMHDGVRGITRERMLEEREIAASPTSESTDMWGIMARVSDGEGAFDIPVAMDLEETAAANILDVIDGMEEAIVDLEALGELFEDGFSIRLHAGNWAGMRDMQADMTLDMVDALAFRRPATWDIIRARLSQLAPEPLPPFDEEAFYLRLARSVRFDADVMVSNRAMVDRLSAMDVKPGGTKWGEWFPAVVDLLRSIGDPTPMDGMSVVINFVVEEPLSEQPDEYSDPDHPDHTPFADMEVVGHHNLVVGFGLHPLTAVALYDAVMANSRLFFDLEDRDDRQYRMIGVSVVQDTMLSIIRGSLNGRTAVYERMHAAQEGGRAERAAPAEAEVSDDGAITF